MTRARRPAAKLGSLSGNQRIQLLTAALALVGLSLYFAFLRGSPVETHSFHIPWFVLVPIFFLAEISLVNVRFRRDNCSFSMGEMALVLGLLFARPGELLVAHVIASALAFGVHRRLSVLKTVFNVATVFVSAAIGALAFYAIIAPFHDLGMRVWIASYTAAFIYSVLTGICVVAAISLSEGRLTGERMPVLLSMAWMSSFTNTSLALIAGTLFVVSMPTAVLLVVPAGVVFLSYRAYLSEKEKHASLEFLYHSTRILSETPQIDSAVVALASQARRMFRAQSAEMIFASGDPARLVRTRVDEGAAPRVMEPVTDPNMIALWDRVAKSPAPTIAQEPNDDPVFQVFLEAEGTHDLMIAGLSGESRAFGMVIVSNTVGGVPYDGDDLRLFETLANHASVALENGRLEQSLAQLRELEQQLKQLAYHDPLTGLANRALFAERVESALQRIADGAPDCAVLFIDLDDFKTVNDTLGHAAGDQLLVEVAQRLVHCLRPDDMAARLGGDEFAILLEGVASADDAEAVARRITESLRMPITFGAQEVPVRASIGIAPSTGFRNADELLRNADLAMYMAKSDGKGSFKVFEPGMRVDVVNRHQLKADLTRAVDRGDFVVHYQPIVSLREDAPVGVEALVRWHHPELGLLPPSTFIAMAEETGLITAIGGLVLSEACTQVAAWQKEFDKAAPLAVTVNLSPLQVRIPELVGDVADALARTHLAPGSLILEITENLVLDSSDVTLETLRRLRALGVRLALDDFGTGYSSLSQLRRLPVDVLKIDKSFVDDLDGGGENTAFASAIVALAHTLGLTTLAEGIEKPWQVKELRRLGCALGQGFHFAKPMAADEATEYLRARLAPQDAKLARVIPFPA